MFAMACTDVAAATARGISEHERTCPDGGPTGCTPPASGCSARESWRVARMEAYNDNPTVMPAVVRAPVRAGYRLAEDAPVR